MYTIRKSISPSANLRNQYNEILKPCCEDTVSISYDNYQNLKARIELLELLAEADEDVTNERVSPIKDTFNDLQAILEGKLNS